MNTREPRPNFTSARRRSEVSAAAAGLHYKGNRAPGICRRKSGKGFRYLHADGDVVRDAETLARIRSIAIPPAWNEVWISPDPKAHVQATGRDARHRKQYRYHADWRAARDASKFDRLIAFGRALPAIRQRVRRDLRKPGLGRNRVLAAIARLLEISAIRIGNSVYAQMNRSYGLTTLQNRHVRIAGATVRFRFSGKSGHRYLIEISDPRLARIVDRCRAFPGQEVFQYVDEHGELHAVTSADVNSYLRESAGQEFSAKDFRTWTGTLLATLALRGGKSPETRAVARRNVARVVRQVAERLGNTPAVCRKSYIHPAIIDSYLDGTLGLKLGRNGKRCPGNSRLRSPETAVIRILQRRLKQRQPGTTLEDDACAALS